MGWVIGFFAVFGLAVISLLVQAKKAGARQLEAGEIERGERLLRVSADAPGAGWEEIGSRTQTKGLNLRFDHDDDPQAEATLLAPGRSAGGKRSTLANSLTVRLSDAFQTFHVHTSGHVFQIRMRGTGRVIGKETRIKMVVDQKGAPYGGRVENDDDTDAAVGDWIEVESAELIRIRDR